MPLLLPPLIGVKSKIWLNNVLPLALLREYFGKTRYHVCNSLYNYRALLPRDPSQLAQEGREELPWVRSQGRRPPGATPCPEPEARGGSQEELPHVQGAVAVQAQEDLEELPHVEGQDGRR